MNERITRIEISKEDIKFSAAHFTMFSATERERLHGHNFAVHVSVDAPVLENGMCFSYLELKERIRRLCRELDEYTILPMNSPYLECKEEGDLVAVTFDGASMYFLRSDIKGLPITNSTVEEYSNYLLTRLLDDDDFVERNDVRRLAVKVASGPGQSGASTWIRAGS